MDLMVCDYTHICNSYMLNNCSSIRGKCLAIILATEAIAWSLQPTILCLNNSSLNDRCSHQCGIISCHSSEDRPKPCDTLFLPFYWQRFWTAFCLQLSHTPKGKYIVFMLYMWRHDWKKTINQTSRYDTFCRVQPSQVMALWMMLLNTCICWNCVRDHTGSVMQRVSMAWTHSPWMSLELMVESKL